MAVMKRIKRWCAQAVLCAVPLLAMACSRHEAKDPTAKVTLEKGQCTEISHGTIGFQLCSPPDGATDMMEFILRIRSTKGPNSPIMSEEGSKVAELADYYSFGFRSHIYLTDGEHYHEPALYNFSRNYNTTPYIEFALAFDISDVPRGRDYTLVINDVIHGKGLIKYPIHFG